MLQIVHESEPMEVAGYMCYVDYILEGNYMTMAIDLREYEGPRSELAKGADVMLCGLDEVPDIFGGDRNAGLPFSWGDYCRYINSNAN